jgi:phenylpyruvate tautomerase
VKDAGNETRADASVATWHGPACASVPNPNVSISMPYLQIQTNLPMTKRAKQSILQAASLLVAEELGKPQEFVMIALQPNTDMIFAGTEDPVAFLELKSVGLPGRQTRRLSSELCSLIQQHLGISPSRTYVKFIDVRHGMWGWKGDTFEATERDEAAVSTEV